MKKIDILIRGESEKVLLDIADSIDSDKKVYRCKGIAYKNKNEIILNEKQEIFNDLDFLSPYDYEIFNAQSLLRPYNGEVIKSVDYEMSRGCIYSCAYCVETIIQKYYGFNEKSNNGAIKNFKSYLRHKSPEKTFEEIKFLHEKLKIKLFRCQDTNFLTIDRNFLKELSELIKSSNLDIYLYIETRPEGINPASIELLKSLKVDGVGMGVELASEEFREEELNRFASQKKTIEAFRLLKENNIKRTSYNVIGFPNQTEESIKATIEFNKLIKPDNITVAFYSPYHGTEMAEKGYDNNMFDAFQPNVDSQLRSTSKDSLISVEKLNYYKKNFLDFVYDKS